MEELSRTEMLLGEEAVETLRSKRVIVFGVGGVGGYVCEALARTGVGQIDLVDNDTVSLSNINRQIIALHSTVGRSKVEVMKERIFDINPDIRVNAYNIFFVPENSKEINLSQYDYVVDAIDTVSAKIELAKRAEALGVPLIASMGTGNKLDPTKLRVSDIQKTEVCPLARTVRALCKKQGIRHLRVVWSPEEPVRTTLTDEHGRHVPGSISFVPAAAGLLLAAEVIKALTAEEN